MTLILIITHLLAVALGAYLYKAYAAKLISDAQEAKAWAEEELADFKSAYERDVAALKAKLGRA